MTIDPATGLLSEAEYLPSPHQDARPEGTVIDLVVIHGISLPPGEFGSNHVQSFFTGQLQTESHPYFASIADLRVSAHLFIQRDGHIIQFVPFMRRAWHAGTSNYCGKMSCNDFSIGIELEGTDEIPYEVIQYQQLLKVARSLQKTYTGITHERIVGHQHIAPLRKTDPGPAFDWAYFKENL